MNRRNFIQQAAGYVAGAAISLQMLRRPRVEVDEPKLDRLPTDDFYSHYSLHEQFDKYILDNYFMDPKGFRGALKDRP